MIEPKFRSYWTKDGGRMVVSRDHDRVSVSAPWGGRFLVTRKEAADMLRYARRNDLMMRLPRRL